MRSKPAWKLPWRGPPAGPSEASWTPAWGGTGSSGLPVASRPPPIASPADVANHRADRSGIDGAVSWEHAATETIASRRGVTSSRSTRCGGHCARVRICDAVMRIGAYAGALSDASAACGALDSAGRSWRHATRWPADCASADARPNSVRPPPTCANTSTTTCGPRGDWKRPEDMFAEVTAEQLVAVLHSGLQSAIRVGQQVAAAFDGLAHGANRVWLDAKPDPCARRRPTGSGQRSIRWLPDPAGFHSAEGLLHDSAEAVARLVHATPLTIATLATPPNPPRQVDDEAVGETVPVVLDLRTAQERALLAAIRQPNRGPTRSASDREPAQTPSFRSHCGVRVDRSPTQLAADPPTLGPQLAPVQPSAVAQLARAQTVAVPARSSDSGRAQSRHCGRTGRADRRHRRCGRGLRHDRCRHGRYGSEAGRERRYETRWDSEGSWPRPAAPRRRTDRGYRLSPSRGRVLMQIILPRVPPTPSAESARQRPNVA